MRARRKRRKRLIIRQELLWFLVGLSVAVGTALSPITALRTVRIEGAYAYDEERLRGIAAKFRGVPALTLSPWSVESQVLKNPAVKTVNFRRNVFGRATLKITYRTPIAELSEAKGAYLDELGQVFTLPYTFEVPKVSVPESVRAAGFSVFRPWDAKGLADVCKRAASSSVGEGVGIVLDSPGTVCLNTRSGTKISLGDLSQLDEKFRVLEEYLAENPKLLEQSQEIRLTNPDRPVYIPRLGATP